VHVTDNDISILKQKNVSAAANPTSNLKLANGVSPAAKFLSAGVNVALGTDGCASNNNMNMFEELHLTAILHKGINADALAVTARDAIKMATINGAYAIGFNDTGKIKPGYKADIIIIDADKPHMCPLGDAHSAIAYSAQASDVRDVIVNGKILMRGRELLTVDSERAMFRAKKLRGEI